MQAPDRQAQICATCGRAMVLDREGWHCSSCDEATSSKSRSTFAGLEQGEAAEFDPESMVGKVVGGRYRLESVLGQGAMGAVYRGVQLSLTKPYAIKLLLPSLARDAQLVARFQQEARIAASIRHPGLVEVFDFGVEEGIAYYVMELLRGRTLSEYASSTCRLPAQEAVRIVADVAEAVAVAHDRGVIHRDLKPANIFLAQGGADSYSVKVLDFGVSKATVFGSEVPKTTLGSVCGTPAYMSPEQTGRGGVDARSDLYSLGVVLYRLLSGRLPFDAAEAVVVMYMHLERDPPPLELPPGSEVPQALSEALFRALAKRPEDRFASVREFAAALRASVEPRATPDPAGALPEPPPAGPTTEAPPEPAQAEARVTEPSAPPVESQAPRASSGRRWLAFALVGLALCAAAAASLGRSLADRRSGSELLSAIPQPPPPEEGAWDALLEPIPLPPTSMAPAEEGRTPESSPAGPEAKSPEEAKVPGAPREAPTVRQPSPAPAAKHRAPLRENPRPPVAPHPREMAEIALTSKVLGKVEVSVGRAKLELFANRVALVPVPAGKNRVSLSSKDAGISCSVLVEIPANTRRAVVFGPELTSVGVRGPDGIERLSCRK